MHFDVFSEGKSLLHRIDPRLKVLVFIPLAFLVSLSADIKVIMLYLCLSVIFLFIAKINFYELLSRFAAVNVFVLMLWVTLPFNIKGEPLFLLGNMAFSVEGAFYAFIISLKANAILFFTITIIGTTDILVLAHALFHLKCPKRLVYLFMFLYRYVSVLHSEYKKLLDSLKMRAFSPKAGIHTLKVCAYMAGMLFVNSYERSLRIYRALTLRGFRGDFPMLMHFHWHRADMVFGVFMYAFMAGQFLIWK